LETNYDDMRRQKRFVRYSGTTRGCCPLFFNRQHYKIDDCLEDITTKIIRTAIIIKYAQL